MNFGADLCICEQQIVVRYSRISLGFGLSYGSIYSKDCLSFVSPDFCRSRQHLSSSATLVISSVLFSLTKRWTCHVEMKDALFQRMSRPQIDPCWRTSTNPGVNSVTFSRIICWRRWWRNSRRWIKLKYRHRQFPLFAKFCITIIIMKTSFSNCFIIMNVNKGRVISEKYTRWKLWPTGVGLCSEGCAAHDGV